MTELKEVNPEDFEAVKDEVDEEVNSRIKFLEDTFKRSPYYSISNLKEFNALNKKPFITKEMRGALRAPFPKEAHSTIDSKTYLTSIKAAYVIERLNDVFGIGRWDVITKVVSEENGYVLMQGEFVSYDYDVIVPKYYGGHKTEGKGVERADGYKSAVTDCISKTASILEIGIDVFKGEIGGDGISKKEKAIKANMISDADLVRIGEILKAEGATNPEESALILEKYGVPKNKTKDIRKFTAKEGKDLLMKMLTQPKNDK